MQTDDEQMANLAEWQFKEDRRVRNDKKTLEGGFSYASPLSPDRWWLAIETVLL
jgi:hypothetical protein